MRYPILLFIAFLILNAFLFGLYDSPLAQVTRETEIQIDPEYINGILTASSILFGIWAFVLGIKPFESKTFFDKETIRDKELKEFLFKTVVRESFFIGFFFLVIDVLFIFLVSLTLFSQFITILHTAFTFFYNALFLTLIINHYVFK